MHIDTCVRAHEHLHIQVHTHTVQGIPSKKPRTQGGPKLLGRLGNRALPPAVAPLLPEPMLLSGTQAPGAACP